MVHIKLETTSLHYYHNMTARYPHHAAPHISQWKQQNFGGGGGGGGGGGC